MQHGHPTRVAFDYDLSSFARALEEEQESFVASLCERFRAPGAIGGSSLLPTLDYHPPWDLPQAAGHAVESLA
jgi:hypothetical protein